MSSNPDEPILYDVLLISGTASQRVSDQGVRAWVNYFHAMGLVLIVEETLSEDWTELYFQPAYAAHGMFYHGELVEGAPVFQELCLRFGAKSWVPAYEGVEEVFFSLEFRGCTYNRVLDEVTSRTHDILHNNPHVLSKEHDAMPEHPAQEGEAVDKRLKRKERGNALIGTRTEDL